MSVPFNSECEEATYNDCLTHTGKKNKVGYLSEHRRKQLHSAYVFMSFIALGMVVALHGPTFLDLLLILGADIDRGTVLFTCFSFGYLVGSLAGGITYDRFSKEMTMFASSLLMGVFTVAIPWCSSLPLMGTVNFLRGCSAGGLETGGNALIVHIWRTEVGPYIQAVYFAFGFGGIISPLITEPFLAAKPTNASGSVNQTSARHFNSSAILGINVVNDSKFHPILDAARSKSESSPVTNIHVPFAIIGMLTAASALPYLAMCISKQSKKYALPGDTKERREENRHIPLTLQMKVALLILIGAFYACFASVEDNFAGFIMSFVVIHLGWTKSKGAQITSVFWIALSLSRLLAVGVARVLTPWKMLAVDLILLDLVFLILALNAEGSEWFIWVCTVIVAASMASIFPTGLAWIDNRMFSVDGWISSFSMTCTSVGTMCSPLLVGYLFEFTPMWLFYLLFILSIFCTMVFFANSVMVSWIHRKWRNAKNNTNKSSPVLEEDLE